jgi:flavin-dependent dehydrogenase
MADFDIIVVGAGPAGLAAALGATKPGLRVLVLDRKARIGVPVRCGECIAGSALAGGGVQADSAWIARTFTALDAHFSGGRRVTLESPLPGYVLNRDRFEAFLGAAAAERGAVIRLSTPVTDVTTDGVVRTSQGPTTARIIIGADAYQRFLDRKLALRMKLQSRMRVFLLGGGSAAGDRPTDAEVHAERHDVGRAQRRLYRTLKLAGAALRIAPGLLVRAWFAGSDESLHAGDGGEGP